MYSIRNKLRHKCQRQVIEVSQTLCQRFDISIPKYSNSRSYLWLHIGGQGPLLVRLDSGIFPIYFRVGEECRWLSYLRLCLSSWPFAVRSILLRLASCATHRRIFWSRSSHRSLSNAGASKLRAQCTSLSDILSFNPLSMLNAVLLDVLLFSLRTVSLISRRRHVDYYPWAAGMSFAMSPLPPGIYAALS